MILAVAVQACVHACLKLQGSLPLIFIPKLSRLLIWLFIDGSQSIADRLGCRRLESYGAADGCRENAQSSLAGRLGRGGQSLHALPGAFADVVDLHCHRQAGP